MSDLKLPDCMRLLPEETMSVMRRSEWYARRRMVGTLSGRHSSPDKGFSVEFAEHREYSPGDDPKTLDPQAVRAAYLERLRGFVKRIDSACGKLRADYVPVNAKTPLRDTLLRYLGGRR